MKESIISSDARILLRDYAQGHHSTDDLSIETANRVERSLVTLGCGETPNYPAGLLTRQYSRNKVSHFPDQRIQALRQLSSVKENSIPWVSAQTETIRKQQESFFGVRKMSAAIRTILRDDLAESVGASPDEIRNGYIRRLLDKPEICDLLIEYFNEYRVEKFRSRLLESEYFRAGGQRSTHTKNKAKYDKRSTLGSYIARTFCPDEVPSIENKGKTSSAIREAVLNERESLLRELPIDPDKISDESLVKVGLATADFSHYTLQARRRYKMASAEQFLGLLREARMTERKHGFKKSHQERATTARVISFVGADGEEKIGIFSTTTDVMTKTVSSGEMTRNRNHKISATELRIFAGREEAIRSQDHAIESMSEKIEIYAELFNALGDYSKQKPEKKEVYLSSLVTRFEEKFARSQSYHGELIYRYLVGSDESKKSSGILQSPSLIGNLRSTLKSGMRDKLAKIAEIQLIKKDI